MKNRKSLPESVRAFLHHLADNASTGFDPRSFPEGPSWFRAGDGMLILDSDEYRRYQKVLAELIDRLAPSGDLSESTVASALTDAAFDVLDIRKVGNPDPNARVTAAVERLKALAAQESELFECWIEVGGVHQESLPCRYGRVRFVKFNEYRRRRFYKSIRDVSPDSHKPSASRIRSLVDARQDHLLGSSFGVVECPARDSKAATTLAKGEIRETLECMNFFSDLIPYNHSWLYLPGEQESTGTTAIAVGGRGSVRVSSSQVGPLGGYAISRIASQKGIGKVAKRISRLLQIRDRNRVEELLLTSVRWAGRATVSPLREEAFMLYAIALECIVLPGTDGELRHRLSQRVGRMVPGTVASRIECRNATKKLYDIRSKIVHSGHYEVGEDDLYQIRTIAKGVILRLLSSATVAEFRTIEALEDWYERRMLE